jgi:hypothetical protein
LEKQETKFGFIEIKRLKYFPKLKPYAGFISNTDFDIVVENDSNNFIKLKLVKTNFKNIIMHIALYMITWALIFQNKVWAFCLKIKSYMISKP